MAKTVKRTSSDKSTRRPNREYEKKKKKKISKIEKKGSKKFVICGICLDEIGTNPPASTRCGHVYCMKCLKQALEVAKRCPTCRRHLKGRSAYHPLYFN